VSFGFGQATLYRSCRQVHVQSRLFDSETLDASQHERHLRSRRKLGEHTIGDVQFERDLRRAIRGNERIDVERSMLAQISVLYVWK